VSPHLPPIGLRLARSRGPAGAWRLVAVLVLVVGVAAHVPVAAPFAVGLAALVVVLSALWLRGPAAVAALVALCAVALPWPVTAVGAGLTVAGGLLLTLASRTVAALTTLMLSAQESALRQAGAHAELARRTQAEREQLSTQLEEVASRDPLTGLLHRVGLLRHLELVLAAGQPVGVLVLSLVRFGDVNDAYGADVGDELLAAVAERLRSSARGSDVVGRIGGDEFAVLLTGLTWDYAAQVAARLPQLLSDPFTIGPHVIQLTARAGLALQEEPNPNLPAVELMRHATVTARSTGPGGAAQVYDPAAKAAAAELLELENDMARGLENSEFFLLYQPLVCSRTGRMLSVEALVRWQHPTRGLIPPDAFIGIAEKTGLIVPLGLHVLRMALAQVRAWNAVAPGITVAVNVSARQLVEPDFLEQVRQILWSSAVDPRNVILELTESMIMEDADTAVAVLWQLRGLGVGLALDDFGTGYSSLARLGDLPLDELKIDKSFVDRLGAATGDSTALVTAAVAMGHGLGLHVVAEGVETVEQAALLSSVGCDLLQGYLLGRPQPPDVLVPQFGHSLLPSAAALPQPRPADPRPTEIVVPRLMPDLRTG